MSLLHDFPAGSYWAARRTRAVIERPIRHSLCFGACSGERQVGFEPIEAPERYMERRSRRGGADAGLAAP